MPVIQLVSSDGEKFPVELDIIKQSVTIKTMLEDLGIDDDSNSEPVPLPNVEASILGKIIEWCNKHKDDARDKFTEISLSKLPEWYVEKNSIPNEMKLLFSRFFWLSFFLNDGIVTFVGYVYGLVILRVFSTIIYVHKFYKNFFYIFRDEKEFFPVCKPYDQGDDQKILFDLILAANYLDIKGILDLGCKIVAKKIQELPDAEAIRRHFNITNDLPKEDSTENA